MGWEVIQDRMFRWGECGLCEQRYHGVVLHALGWACWKTYLGRPDRYMAKNDSGNDASDFCEAFAILNDLCKRYTRVLGAQHPETIFARELLEVSRPVAESADVLVDIRKKKAAILRAADGA